MRELVRSASEHAAEAARVADDGMTPVPPQSTNPTQATTPPATTPASREQPPTPRQEPDQEDAKREPGRSEGGGLPGAKSDREAIAAAAKKSNAVRPGQVLAAEGLEIKTRAPRWTTTMLYLYRPQNPVLNITFGRDGRVTNAELVRVGKVVYGSGYDDIDQTLLNAVYGWTATGKPLLELDPEQPDRGITITMTIILRG